MAPGGRGLGDFGQLFEDGAAGSFGRVGGKDGLQRRPVDQVDHFLRRHTRLHQSLDQLLKPSLDRIALHVQVFDPVHLFDDVGQMEVDGKGPYQLEGELEIHVPEQGGQLMRHLPLLQP